MTQKPSIHENYRRTDEVKAGSNRSLGVVFAGVFTVVGLLPLYGGGVVRPWALGLGAIFLFLALVVPAALGPLNRVWFRFGMLLHKVVNPLVMGLLFFLTITPFAVVMRLLGKDPLNRRFDDDVDSYWIKRQPPGPAPETMKRPF